MKVVIDIDKKLYDRMKTYHGLDDAYFSIKHGIQLDDFMRSEVNEEDPIYCDRNICIRNDYNDIGCEVTKRRKNEKELGGICRMIDNSNYVGYLVFSKDPTTHLHIGLGMFPTYYKAVAMAYADAATRHIPDCIDNDVEATMSSLYKLEGGDDWAFDVIDDKKEVDVTYYILLCYNDKDICRELGFNRFMYNNLECDMDGK